MRSSNEHLNAPFVLCEQMIKPDPFHYKWCFFLMQAWASASYVIFDVPDSFPFPLSLNELKVFSELSGLHRHTWLCKISNKTTRIGMKHSKWKISLIKARLGQTLCDCDKLSYSHCRGCQSPFITHLVCMCVLKSSYWIKKTGWSFPKWTHGWIEVTILCVWRGKMASVHFCHRESFQNISSPETSNSSWQRLAVQADSQALALPLKFLPCSEVERKSMFPFLRILWPRFLVFLFFHIHPSLLVDF